MTGICTMINGLDVICEMKEFQEKPSTAKLMQVQAFPVAKFLFSCCAKTPDYKLDAYLQKIEE